MPLKPMIATMALATAVAAVSALAADDYYDLLDQQLMTEFGLSGGNYIIGGNESNVFQNSAIKSFINSGSISRGTRDAQAGDPLGVTRKAFGRLNAFSRHDWEGHIRWEASGAGVSAGDALLASFWMRTTDAQSVTGTGLVRAQVQQGNNRKRINLLPTPQWKQYYVKLDASGNDDFRFEFPIGYQKQEVEIAGLALINFGNTNLSRLPQTEVAFDWVGRTHSQAQWQAPPDDPAYDWLRQAHRDIEQVRQTPVTIEVIDREGNRVEGAQVAIKQQARDFGIGTSTWYGETIANYHPSFLQRWQDLKPDDGRSDDRFNLVSSNDVRWSWHENISERTEASVDWLAAQEGVRVFGHTLMWGDRNNMPSPGGDYPDSFAEIRAHIHDYATKFKGRIDNWDLFNEGHARSIWEKQAGSREAWLDELADWFKIAHAADPDAKLWLNDNNMLSGGAVNYNRVDYYVDLYTELVARGAPVYGLGLQAHFGNDGWKHFSDPVQMKAVLDRLAATGMKLRISELDYFNTPRNAEGHAIDADFVRDFLTLVYSHEAVEEVVWWGLSPDNHWKDDAPLFVFKDGKATLSPAGLEMYDLFFEQWWTDLLATTDRQGLLDARVFEGEHLVTASLDGDLVEMRFRTEQLDNGRLVLTLSDTLVPEPATAVLMAAGLTNLMRRRRSIHCNEPRNAF